LSKYERQYQALLAKHSGEVNIYFNDASLTTNATNITTNGLDGGPDHHHGTRLVHSSPRVEPLLEHQHHHPSTTPANAVPMETVVSTPSSFGDSPHSQRPIASAPRDPMSYIPMVMPIVKQELMDSGPSGQPGFESTTDSNYSRDQPPVLGGPTTLEAVRFDFLCTR
jgi:hypothetical protein